MRSVFATRTFFFGICVAAMSGGCSANVPIDLTEDAGSRRPDEPSDSAPPPARPYDAGSDARPTPNNDAAPQPGTPDAEPPTGTPDAEPPTGTPDASPENDASPPNSNCPNGATREVEPNDSPQTATLATGNVCGTLSTGTDKDYFVFDRTEANGGITVSADLADGLIVEGTTPDGGFTSSSTLSFTMSLLAGPGRYILSVSSTGGQRGPYSVRVGKP